MEHNPARTYKGPVGVVLEPFVRRARGRGLTKNRYAWKTHRLIWRGTRSNRVIIDGHDYQLDLGDALALASGSYAPAEKDWYNKHVRPGDVVVEAGANIGYFTLILARLVGETGRVISYEPDPALAAILRRNVAFNGYRNVTVREAACSDAEGDTTFYRSPVSTGDNRLFPHGANDDSFAVKVVRLDDDLARLEVPVVDVLKMDIQGAEPLAMSGFSAHLTSNPPREMLIEFMPSGMLGMGNDPVAMIEAIEAAGFEITVQDGYAETPWDGQPFDVHAALTELTLENQKWVNIACHRERD